MKEICYVQQLKGCVVDNRLQLKQFSSSNCFDVVATGFYFFRNSLKKQRSVMLWQTVESFLSWPKVRYADLDNIKILRLQ
jgi:hypothetical protein